MLGLHSVSLFYLWCHELDVGLPNLKFYAGDYHPKLSPLSWLFLKIHRVENLKSLILPSLFKGISMPSCQHAYNRVLSASWNNSCERIASRSQSVFSCNLEKVKDGLNYLWCSGRCLSGFSRLHRTSWSLAGPASSYPVRSRRLFWSPRSPGRISARSYSKWGHSALPPICIAKCVLSPH